MISRSTISTNLQRQTPAGSRSGERFRLTWQLGLFALIQRFRAIRTIKRGSSTSLIPAFGLWGVSASCSELLARGTGNLLASCIDQSKGAPGYDVLPRILRLRTRQSCRQQSKKAPEREPFEKLASESISRVLSLDDHLSRTRVTARLKHATRMHGRAAVWHSYLRLLQMGFSKPRCCQRAGALLPHRFSFSPACAGEFTFLWHFPSGRPAQPLAGILPFGARTFLTPLKAARDRLARSQCGILPYRNRNKEHHDNLRIGWRHIFQRTRFHGTL